MTDKALRNRKTYARPDDPTSPFIWGRYSDLLTDGGFAWDATKRTHLTNKDGKPRKPQRKEFYEDEYLTEPDPNISSLSTIGWIMWAMVVAGFTFAECEDAMLDPRNLGGAYWHFRSLTDKGWSDFAKEMWHGRTYVRAGVHYVMVPVSESVSAPEGNACFHEHPSVSLSTPNCVIGIMVGKEPITQFPYQDDLLVKACERIANTHGMGVRECITEVRQDIKSERKAKSYVYEAIARGYIAKEPNGPGRKAPVTLTPEGRAFIQNYLDARAVIARDKRLAALPTPEPIPQGDGLTVQQVLDMLAL